MYRNTIDYIVTEAVRLLGCEGSLYYNTNCIVICRSRRQAAVSRYGTGRRWASAQLGAATRPGARAARHCDKTRGA